MFRKKEDKTESSLDEQLPNEDANDTEEVNVSRTLTYEVQEEEEKSKNEEVKLIWKNSSGLPSTAKTSKGLATKAFFTPTTGENQTNDTEQVMVFSHKLNDLTLNFDILRKKFA